MGLRVYLIKILTGKIKADILQKCQNLPLGNKHSLIQDKQKKNR